MKQYFEAVPVSEGLPEKDQKRVFVDEVTGYTRTLENPSSEYVTKRFTHWLRPLSLAVPESEDAFFEKSKILGEYSIDLINQSDEFNGQMLAAMEAYAQFRLLASRDEEIKRLREAAEQLLRFMDPNGKPYDGFAFRDAAVQLRALLTTNTTPTNE